MYAESILVALVGFASTASAAYDPRALNGIQNLKPGVAVRQEGTACTASALSIAASIPTPTGELLSLLSSYAATADVTNPTQACEITAAIPSSLSSQYSSYDSAVSSWYDGESSNIADLISKCSSDPLAQTISSAIGDLNAYTASGCSGLTATGTQSVQSETGSASSVPSTTTPATAGVPKPTAAIAGAAAAAGFIGAVAML
ncbi:hypothetical protein JX265_006020 [Neoarthrinium moseri]|uniref:DUF7735 domain-containing protein n=1 Tax=Neoarthrinium moseri TaxID=1658444 RepID=A0A9P9WMF6_9PEZI|nr:hypothetical protein JX265_006020 [Neoarthrinium moseri]